MNIYFFSKRLFLILIFLINILINLSVLSAKTWSVCLESCDFQKIQNAITQASAYDTINIKDDKIYQVSTIRINKPLTLNGLNKPIVDGMYKRACFLCYSR